MKIYKEFSYEKMRIERVSYGRKMGRLGRWDAVGMGIKKLCEEMMEELGQK